MAAVAVASSIALLGGMLLAAPASASDSNPHAFHLRGPMPVNGGTSYPAGTYIVQLRDAPAATYSGGVAGYARTRPQTGHQLNAHSSSVKSYMGHLASQQSSVLRRNGVRAIQSYTVTYNGFAAKLTAAQATKLANDKSVLRITKDRVLKIQDDTVSFKNSSLDYLKVADQGSTPGLWSAIGGHANAGAGIVIGDIDTGIAPDNPSFAGTPLQSTGNPSLSGNKISFTKANSQTFTSTEVAPADHWTNSDYSTKIIAAKFYDQGWLTNDGTCPAADCNPIAPNPTATTPGDYLSPRDGDNHGSHTASTAAGNYGVEATAGGIDYGTISGIAPAAKIAVYKACWSAPNPANDGCSEIDLLSAINQATIDGVDVINYSIGGGPAQTIYSPTDEAFLNATAAGIFVSAAAGNAGPGASTLDNAAPWETTVAASTVASFEATAKLGNGKEYVGASITVKDVATADSSSYDPTQELHAPLVLATAVKKSTVSSSHAVDCRTGSLNPAKVAGKVVVCDRDGKVNRTEMSATVAAAGGVGAILVNTTPEDTDTDAHSVPTIHIDQPSRSAIRAYAAKSGATVTFIPWNAPAVANPALATPLGQIAGFSSRGPVKAGGSDVLKPDIAAPGVSILAAYADAPTTVGDPTLHSQWGFDSGTSMATPHITGLAALYLAKLYMNSPPATIPVGSTPAEIKSAMMTTAVNALDSHGNQVTNPFAQGAGVVYPTNFLNPGLVYPATEADWKSYIAGTGETDFPGVTPIDPSDLNQASIAIGALAGTQTVVRTVKATSDGTYTPHISGLAGIHVTVDTPTITLTTGQTATYHVTFTRTTAALKKYATGSITWTDTSTGTTVRSPIAVQPTAVATSVSGTGTNGTVTVPTALGVNGTTALHLYGLAAGDKWPDVDGDTPPANYTHHFTSATVADPLTGKITDNQSMVFAYQLTSSTTFVKFAELPNAPVDPKTDLDEYVYYSTSFTEDATKWKPVAQSATSKAAESVQINKPKAGIYYVLVDPYAINPAVGADMTLIDYQVKSTGGSGHLNASSSSIRSSKTGVQSFRLGWGGLTADTSYLGLIRYGSGTTKTVVNINSGSATAPINIHVPTISGRFVAGRTLTASPGTWNVSTKYLGITYDWLRNGVDTGAHASTYLLGPNDFAQSISLRATTSLLGSPTSADSSAHTIQTTSRTSFALGASTISHTVAGSITVTITPALSSPLTGTAAVKVRYGTKAFTTQANFSSNVATISLPTLKKGSYKITVTFEGSPLLLGSTSAAHTLKVT
ncbi:MAG: putative secreted peptidase [Glaciihabitans sp.]|nr:putative secreted peptidase [Glaciihabitans sp.]